MHIGTCKSFSLSFGLSIFFFSQQHNINIFWEVKKKTQRKEREKSNGCNRDVRKRKVKRFCLLYDWKKNERDNSRWMKEVKKYGHTKQFAVSSMFSLIWFFFDFIDFANSNESISKFNVSSKSTWHSSWNLFLWNNVLLLA